MPTPAKKPAGVYLRISLDKTGEELGLDRQRAACEEIAAKYGWTTVEYPDNSVSASSARKPSSQYARLVDDARAGRIGAVIVWDLDRLTRRPREIEDWIDLAAEGKGVRLITADGEVDTRSENGRMFMRIKAAVARHEIEHKGARMKSANEQRAFKGIPPPGGRRAFGYSVDGMTLVEPEAATVREAYAAILGGASLYGLAKRWNAVGMRTGLGGEWMPKAVGDVLRNPRNAGLVVYRGVVREDVTAKWPTIVEEDVWRGVVAILDDPERRTSPLSGGSRRYLLPGLARCGVEGCGARMTTGGNRRGIRSLKCTAQRHLERIAEPIEAYVAKAALAILGREDAAPLFEAQKPDVAPLRTEAAALRARRIALADNLEIDEVTLARRDRALRKRLEEIQAAMSEAVRGSALAPFTEGGDPEEVWEGLDLEQRRAVIAELFGQVVVLPVGQGARVRADGISRTVRLGGPRRGDEE